MHFKFYPKKEIVAVRLAGRSKKLEPKIREVFIGRHKLFSVRSFIVGGMLLGSSLWVYSTRYLGLPMTMVFGLCLFIIAGVAVKTYRKNTQNLFKEI